MKGVEDIIEDWVLEYGIWKDGKWGRFQCIAFEQNKDLVRILAEIFVEEGYDKKDLFNEDGKVNAVIQAKVVMACESPGKTSRKKSAIIKTKNMTAENWRIALKAAFLVKKDRTKNTKIAESPKKEPKVERLLEVDPSDRIKMDTSDVVDSPLDPDFLKELGLDESFMSGKKDE